VKSAWTGLYVPCKYIQYVTRRGKVSLGEYGGREGPKPKLKQSLIVKSVNSFHRIVPNPILRKASRKRIGRT